ncbi:MAG: proline dehydrogenase family protein [Acidobacteria bacterium]|nr:proline dehydrogenase family protein [Acidobacteriota bacterium]
MSISRSLLLAGSQSRWLRERATRYRFVRRAVSRFMPGEELEDALAAARELERKGLRTIFTKLGENITEESEAAAVAEHYLGALDRIRELGLMTELSVKLTQLGLDLGGGICYVHLERIIVKAGTESVVWIDMEASEYVDRTLELFRRAKAAYPNVGVCLQAYLYRTADDLGSLIPTGSAIRLVKGAYREPPDRAFPRKKDVDENFFDLAKKLLSPEARRAGVRAGIATHDLALIRRVEQYAASQRLGKEEFEFQMLYGIQRAEQLRLARDGYQSHVLLAYGSYWFPWYMRRLAERPANVMFVLRNLFTS